MEPFSVCLSLIPVAIYLLIFGLINVSNRPRICNGICDTALLCFAVSGMVFVGPISIFFPINAAIQFGNYIWIFLVTLYILISLLVILLQRPRITVYNINPVLFKSLMADVVNRLDKQSRWAGDSVFLPTFNISLHLEIQNLFNNVSLISNTSQSNRDSWNKLEKALKSELSDKKSDRNPWSILFFVIGTVLLIFCTMTIIY